MVDNSENLQKQIDEASKQAEQFIRKPAKKESFFQRMWNKVSNFFNSFSFSAKEKESQSVKIQDPVLTNNDFEQKSPVENKESTKQAVVFESKITKKANQQKTSKPENEVKQEAAKPSNRKKGFITSFLSDPFGVEDQRKAKEHLKNAGRQFNNASDNLKEARANVKEARTNNRSAQGLISGRR